MIDDEQASTVPVLVPARMVNEVLYCERLMYLEWSQGEFADNYFTVDGNFAHRRADRQSGEVPDAGQEPERPYKARSVWLSSERLGITTKIDVVEGAEDGSVSVVEYKRGSPPDVPELAYLPERAQVCAQVLVLRDNGYRVSGAEIYFAAAKQRVIVVIDDALVAATEGAVARVRELCSIGEIPPPLVDSPKCNGCSLIGICLPDETNVLRGVDEEKEVRRLHSARDDKAPLHVQEQGARVGLRDDCLVVKSRAGESTTVRLVHISGVAVYGNAQVSTQAMRALLYRGLPVSFFTTGGWYCGRASGMDSKNIEVRIAQFSKFANATFALRIARGIVESKIKNCRTFLRRNAEVESEILGGLDRLAGAATAAPTFEELLGLEGAAAHGYFGAFSSMLRPPNGSIEFSFAGRNRRPPRDPVNALLSLVYALLVKDLSTAVATVGLDPLLGFYHQPRFGRPSLVLDLMEEFRPIVADSVVVTAINTGEIHASDFVRSAGACALIPAARRVFIQAYERRMDQLVTHPVFGYKISYRRVLEVQARLLTRVLLGEIADYPQFRTR